MINDDYNAIKRCVDTVDELNAIYSIPKITDDQVGPLDLFLLFSEFDWKD